MVPVARPLPSIDADITRARTLDARFYLDEGFFAAARERVFARSWQWLGDLEDMADFGSVSPRTLLPGHLDEPLLLTHDLGGTLRAVSNVCTHRANLLVDAPSRCEQIRCRYHSRRFGLDGRMLFMPGFEGAQDFPGERDHLPQVDLATWGGHAFVSLEPAHPFDAIFGPVMQRMDWLPLQDFRHDAARDRDFTVAAHWALYVENYLEGLHIPFLHPALNRALDWSGYRYEQVPQGTLQVGLAAPGEAAFDDLPAVAPDSPENGERVAAYYWWLFPNLMLNFYPWGLSLNLVQPLGPALTRVSFRTYVHRADRLGTGAGSGLDQVEMEDEAAVEAVQRGLRARLYRGGRYSPRHEAGVHHFHRLLLAALDRGTDTGD